MHPGATGVVPSAIAAGALVLLHLLGERIRIFRRPGARSFGAGFSLAYVFLHLLPDIGTKQAIFGPRLWLPHAQLFAVALIGLLGAMALIGLGRGEREAWRLYLPIAVYNGLLGRLLVGWEFSRPAGLALTTIALAIHVGLIDREARERDAAAWRRAGRFVVAGAVAIGWALGEVTHVPEILRAHGFALVAGILVGTSLVTEVDPLRPVRFRAVVVGVIAFTLLGLAIRPFFES